MVVGVLLSLPLHVGLLFVSLAMLTEAVEVEHASSEWLDWWLAGDQE